MPFSIHINSPADLVTSYAQTRAGFLNIALEKNQYATPFVTEAKALKVAVADVKKPKDLLSIEPIQAALLTASGLSDKALGHLTAEDKQEAIINLIEQFLEPAGQAFIDELIFRFLLTRGDSLGGQMRNLAGKIAEQIIIRAIVASLSIQGKAFYWLDTQSQKWLKGQRISTHLEKTAKGLHWLTDSQPRTLLFNLTVPIVQKNVDLCLLASLPTEITRRGGSKSKHHEPSSYIALGELKGGIDPAGADEHWKTANSALSRVREAFNKQGLQPHLFFTGAAIANAMAEEIYSQLTTGALSNAANLTEEQQLFSLIHWLINL